MAVKLRCLDAPDIISVDAGIVGPGVLAAFLYHGYSHDLRRHLRLSLGQLGRRTCGDPRLQRYRQCPSPSSTHQACSDQSLEFPPSKDEAVREAT